MFAKERETFTVTTNDNFVSFVKETLYERDATAGVSESPVQWCNKNFHNSQFLALKGTIISQFKIQN